MFIGLLILIIGVVLLLQNLSILTASVWEVVWPVLIIAFGLSLIAKREKCCWGWPKSDKEGGSTLK